MYKFYQFWHRFIVWFMALNLRFVGARGGFSFKKQNNSRHHTRVFANVLGWGKGSMLFLQSDIQFDLSHEQQ